MRSRIIPALLLALSPFLALRAAAPAKADGSDPSPVEGFTFIRTLQGIHEYRLDANRLQVLLMPDHSVPVFTFMVTYHVGSRNEVTGATGATHLLEHLMFKGSQHYNYDLGTGFDTLLDRIGATNNATTWLDRTNYFEEVPSEHLDLIVQVEADRMRGLLLRESDRQPEMTVVRNEFERGENDPVEALDKEITAVAYLAHPYHHSTIGWRSDIEKVPIEKLRGFYDTFYWPNNATVTIIGDFNPATALRLIGKFYGPIPASPQPIPQIYTEEPPQQGPRRVTVKRPGELGVVGLAYKTPAATHADHAPLVVLADILADGKTSRFYRALTDANLTLGVDAYKGLTHDPGLFTIYARLAPGVAHAQVEKALLAEVDRVKSEGVTAAEVARALSKENASTAYNRDGSFAIASQVNEDIAIGDWTHYFTLPEKINAVTVADVNRVAKAYLQEDQSTTGWFIPLGADAAATEAMPAPAKRAAPGHPYYYRDPVLADNGAATPSSRHPRAADAAVPAATAQASGALIAPRVVRRVIANLDVLTLKTSLQNVVTFQGSLFGGDVFNPAGRSALADLTAGMLDQGTTKRDKVALSQQLEDVGAEIGFGSTTQNLAFSGHCLKQDVPLVLGLLAEQLRSPAFSTEEFAKLKKQLAGQYRRQLEDTGFRASQALARAVYPEGHPNRPPDAVKYLADIEAATLDEIKAFHAAHYGPTGMVFVAVGDVDGATIDRALRDGFGGWTGGTPPPAAPKVASLAVARTEQVAMAGKTSVSVVIGQPSGLQFSDPDRMALELGTQIFGGHFFSSRLLAIVRNQEGLTYGIGARLGNDTYTDGDWRIVGTFGPELLGRGLASTQRELRRFTAQGVTADELRDFKIAVSGTYQLSLATSEGLASRLLATVQRGLPLSFVDDYPAKIKSLTLEQVNTAVRKYLAPDRMVLVEAGTLPEAVAHQ